MAHAEVSAPLRILLVEDSEHDAVAFRRAFRKAFFGEGTFRERVEMLAATDRGDPRVARMVEFIRGGKRKLAMPRDAHEQDD